MEKQILYISYDGITDPLGQSQILPYIIGLTKKNYKFHIISFEKPNRFKKKKNEIFKICKLNEIFWHPISYTKKPPLISTIWDVYKMRKKASEIRRNIGVDLIHCRSYISSLIGLKFKMKYDVPFIFDMRGFWADERVDGNLWNLKNPIFYYTYKYFKNKEKEFLQNAAFTISLTKAGKDEILNWSKLQLNENSIKIIPCCADLDLFRPYIKETKKFVLGYLGSLGTWYLLNEMLEFYKKLLTKKPDACFHFITKDNPKMIINSAKKLKLPINQIKIEECNRTEIPKKTKEWNYSIFFIKPSYSKISSSPTKQGELMGLGIPVICNKGVGDVDHS